ncbi:MAG: hypothetical protein ABS808_04150 [Wolbachia endosymbiont of Polyergus mexicanus]|uniref:Uncharacterized protein n=1 Tax=Wolbachia endosymbiont of Polyergus mexicanus TaxID=3171167 RepID=A0AAU7YGS2_9RICK
MYKCNLKVKQMVSSQCLTLGSRNFVDCMIWKTLFKSHWILVSHIQLHECCDLKAISTGKPVLDYLDPASHVTSSKMLCFNIRLATFLLINLINFLDPSVKHWDDRSGCWDDKDRH